MMGEASLEMSPKKNNMIEDMINSDNMNSTESTIPNIFKTIKEQYGASTLSKCRQVEKTQLKHARYTNHLRFSLRCLHNNLIPNDLYLKPKMQDPKSRKILDKASRLLLQNRIHENHNIRKTLQSSIQKTKWELSNTLNQEHLSYMQKIHNSTYQKELAKAKERQLKKFTKLHVKKLVQQAETCNSTNKSKWVINLSSHDINKDEKELLEKGLNYSITPTTIPAVELVAKIETVLAGMPTEEANTIHADLSSVIRRTQVPKPNCTRNQIAALKSLQQNDNIIILPAGKGRATVILNKEDYIRKCNVFVVGNI